MGKLQIFFSAAALLNPISVLDHAWGFGSGSSLYSPIPQPNGSPSSVSTCNSYPHPRAPPQDGSLKDVFRLWNLCYPGVTVTLSRTCLVILGSQWLWWEGVLWFSCHLIYLHAACLWTSQVTFYTLYSVSRNRWKSRGDAHWLGWGLKSFRATTTSSLLAWQGLWCRAVQLSFPGEPGTTVWSQECNWFEAAWQLVLSGKVLTTWTLWRTLVQSLSSKWIKKEEKWRQFILPNWRLVSTSRNILKSHF